MPGAAVTEHGCIATDVVVSIEPRRSSRHAASKIAQTVPPPACLEAQAIMPASPDTANTPQASVEGTPAAGEVAIESDKSSPGAPAAQAAGGTTVATRSSGRSRQRGAHPEGRVTSPVERLRSAGTGRKTTDNNIRAQPPQSICKEENEEKEGEEEEEEEEQQTGAAEADKIAGPGQQRPRRQQPTAVKACGKAVKKAGKKAGGGAGKEAGATLAASEASGASNTSELSSFERQRAALIARNNAMLAALALPQLALAVNGLVSPAAASGVKGLRKRSRAADANPTESGSDADTTRVRRSSARVRGQAADPMLAAGIASESARGGIVLQASSHEHSIWGLSGGIVSAGKKAGTSVGPAQPSEPDVRQPTGPLPFTSDNASAAADEAVLRWLQASTPSLTLPDPPPTPTPASVAAAAELGAEVGAVDVTAAKAELTLKTEEVAIEIPALPKAEVTAAVDAAVEVQQLPGSPTHTSTATLPLNTSHQEEKPEGGAGVGGVGVGRAGVGGAGVGGAGHAWQVGPVKRDSVLGLRLQARDVAKVVQDAVTHLAWHPAADRLLLAAGEKSGQVALWKVDDTPLPGGPEGFDGVLTFTHVHRKYISGLKWLGRGGSGAAAAHLVTASYDGSVRLLDVEQGMFTDLTVSLPSDMSISALEVEEAGFVAYVGDSEGSIQVVDTRAAAAKLPQGLNLNNPILCPPAPPPPPPPSPARPVTRRINTLSLEPGCQQLLAAACSSGSVAVWDVRRLHQAGQGTGAGGSAGRGEPLSLVQHPNSCQSAYWAPDGSKRLLSTSFDNTLRVWAPAAPAPPAPPPGSRHPRQPGTEPHPGPGPPA
ncbi:WD40-repeat-containing domain protein [Haematococcus lacustris]